MNPAKTNKEKDLSLQRQCPVSGMPVKSSPEWTNVFLTHRYKVTYELIGENIVSSIPKGLVNQEGTHAIFKAYDLFREKMGLTGKPYIEISDYGGLENIPSKSTRLTFSELLFQRYKKAHLIAHYIYNVPKPIQWMYNLGKRLKKVPIPMAAVDTYEDAVKRAMAVLKNPPDLKSLPKSDQQTAPRTIPESQVKQYRDELLSYIGSINWDEQGFNVESILKDHPFKTIYDALKVIKTDLDQTFKERHKIEKKYKGLFNHIADPIFVFDQTDYHIVDCNDAFLETYGFSKEEVKSKTPHDFHPKAELARVNVNLMHISKDNPTRYTHITKSGRKIAVEIRTDETEYQGRKAWISTIRDITGRMILENELRQHRDQLETLVKERTKALADEISERKLTQKKYQTLFEASSDAVMLLNEDKFIDCNYQTLKLFGCTHKRQFLKLHPADLSPEVQSNGKESFALANEKITQTIKAGRNMFEWTHHNYTTKQAFPAEVLLTYMELDGEQVIQAVVRDITERKTAEDRLKKSETKYRKIIENMQDIFYRTDINHHLIMISPSGTKLLGYDSEQEILGKDICDLFFKNSPVFHTFVDTLSQEKKTTNFELTIYDKNGSTVPVITSSKYFFDQKGNPLGIEGVITNIKALKETEAELKTAKTKAEEATRAKSEFLANMSHEIRTPLNGITGMVELMLETRLDDDQKELAHTIWKEGESLLDIINSILDFSKIEAGKLELDESPFNLRDLFEASSSVFAINAQKKGLEFISFLPPNAPEQFLGDAGRLRQVLTNLVGNSLKFTSKGEIFIWQDAFEEMDESVKIKICVKDTGIGIPEEKQARIFDSFSQADGSTSRVYGGTGLGTTISKQLVHMMGGDIGFVSDTKKGSTFWFTVVLKKDGNLFPHNKDLFSPMDKKKLRILVVDDHKNSRYVYCEYLKAWGIETIQASNGREAFTHLIESLKTDKGIDLILADFQMPQMDGIKFAKELKRNISLCSIPVIILISPGTIGYGKICQDIGIEGSLTKPIKPKTLKSHILGILDHDKNLNNAWDTNTAKEETKKKPDIGKPRILLAEDYPTNQQIALQHLTREGFDVTLAENGLIAFELFKKQTFDLVLMDIQMPVVDGYESTHQIRNHEKSHPGIRTPIIAMTAHAIIGYREKCLNAGMDDFITKPLKKADLLNIVKKWGLGDDKKSDLTPSLADPWDSVHPDPGQEPEDTTMDLSVAYQEFSNDVQFFNDIFLQFLGRVENQVVLIENALLKKDYKTIFIESHAIKGGAGNLTAQDLSQAATELEKAGKQRDKKKTTEKIELLKYEITRLKTYKEKLKK